MLSKNKISHICEKLVGIEMLSRLWEQRIMIKSNNK